MLRSWDGYRRAYLHIGTHKTGTTALQMFLASNEPALAAAGFLFPMSGRPIRLLGTPLSGQHNIPWDLLGDGRYDAADGSLVEAIFEIERTAMPIAILSSEDFALCFDRPKALLDIRDALRRIGYDPYVVAYLRPQRGYAQSLYTELAKQGAPLGFEAFSSEVLRKGSFSISGYTMPLDYGTLLDPFAACFGEDRTIVRAYAPGAALDTLPRDFVSVVASGLPLHYEAMTPIGLHNSTATYREILDALFTTFSKTGARLPTVDDLAREAFGSEAAALLSTRFAPFGIDDAAAYAERFEASNALIERRFTIDWPNDAPSLDQYELRAFLEHAVVSWSTGPSID